MESLSVLRYSFHRATIIARLFPGWLFTVSILPRRCRTLEIEVFFFFTGEKILLFVRSRRRLSLNEFYLFIIRIASLSMDFEAETYEYRENSSINISRACVSNSSRNNKF